MYEIDADVDSVWFVGRLPSVIVGCALATVVAALDVSVVVLLVVTVVVPLVVVVADVDGIVELSVEDVRRRYRSMLICAAPSVAALLAKLSVVIADRVPPVSLLPPPHPAKAARLKSVRVK